MKNMFKKVISNSFLVFFSLLLQVNAVQGEDEFWTIHNEDERRRFDTQAGYFADSDVYVRPDDHIDIQLVTAARENDEERVRELLAAGANANVGVRNDRGVLYNLLHEAPSLTLGVIDALLEAGANPNYQAYNGFTPLHNRLSFERIDRLLKAGAKPNVTIACAPDVRQRCSFKGQSPFHFLKDLKAARRLKEEGGDPSLRDSAGNLPSIVKIFPELLEENPSPESQPKMGVRETSCEYVTELSQIKVTQCGRSNICIADANCTFKVGVPPDTTQIERTFQVVCPSFSNGQCPKADDCAMDRSMVKAEIAQRENILSSPVVPQSSGGSAIR